MIMFYNIIDNIYNITPRFYGAIRGVRDSSLACVANRQPIDHPRNLCEIYVTPNRKALETKLNAETVAETGAIGKKHCRHSSHSRQ